MKTMIAIKTLAGTSQSVVAYGRYPFAVHVALADQSDPASHARRWAVTHTPSGQCVGQQYTFKQATAIARELAADRFWLTTDPAKWTVEERDSARAKRDAVFAKIGVAL